ncbi:MAG: glutathione S-transferase [Pseudomonadota bacterium]
MYTLYGHVRSRTLRPLWLLEELGLPYTFVTAAPRSAEARAASPDGKVPVLDTPEGRLTESVAMMTYLSDRHGQFTRAAGTFARAQQDALTHTILERLDALLWENAKHTLFLPEAQRVAAVFPSLRWQFAQNGTALADLLGHGPYLLGADPLVPDFVLAHCAIWALRQDFPLPDALHRHTEMMQARPAFARAIRQEVP